ncbi:hypothetical protein BH09SUM1_BH09SUM1_02640 [soil metagenome]
MEAMILNPTVDSIVQMAQGLSWRERDEIVERLSKCDHPEGDYSDPAVYQKEIAQRALDMREGRVKGIPGEEVFREVDEELGL